MEQSGSCCPVCTLYLRVGITMQEHLETHPKEKVIEALLKVTNGGTTTQSSSSLSSTSTSSSSSSPPSSSSSSLSSQATSETVPVETVVPAQSYVAPPNAAFISQTQNYVQPQTQMTAAVTYQQFVTSNGSAVLPQYIQVPAVVAPSSNVPYIPNQINYVPNQSTAYAQTMYNPLYNPYIPQPYPLVQPVYPNISVVTESNTQTSTSQLTNSVAPTPTSQAAAKGKSDTALKQVSTVATNTTSSKDLIVKAKLKKLPIRSATQTKLRIIKQLGSRTKTTTSTLATVATKSYRITSINRKTNTTAKPSVLTRIKSIKSKPKPLLPKPSNFSSTSAIFSPPPLIPMSRSRSSLSCSEAPPPPPLSKAPCLAQIPSTYQMPGAVKSEEIAADADDPQPKTEPSEKSSNGENVADFVLDHHEEPSVKSVIVESNSAIQVTNSIVINPAVNDKNSNASSSFRNESILPDVRRVDEESDACERDAIFSKSDERENFAAARERCDRFEGEQPNDGEYEEDDEIQEKVFHSIEFEEEKKIAFDFHVPSHDIPREISSANIDRNCDGSDIYIQEESILLSGTREEIPNNKTVAPASAENSSPSNGDGDADGNGDGDGDVDGDGDGDGDGDCQFREDAVNSFDKEARAAEGKSSIASISQARGTIQSLIDSKSVTYTDLQPATNSNVLQDLRIATSITHNNYMEVDGIRIFFNNAPAQTMPLEPIIKFTSSVKTDVTNIHNFVKTKNEIREGDHVVESVIHVVSGGVTQKTDFSSETLPNANGNGIASEGQLCLRDLSPLTLNIQSDEIMPARGELSEQESLGAENSNWGLFHSEGSSAKTPDTWKASGEVPANPVNRNDYETTAKKSFKCSICDQVFRNLKERRNHRNEMHEKSGTSTIRKPKTFGCTHCSKVFASLKERKLHVIQNHYFDAKSKCVRVKEETVEAAADAANSGKNGSDADGEDVKKEMDETSIKCESSIATQTNRSACELTKNCPQCNLSISGTKRLKEHLKEVHGVFRYKCATCSETFDLERDYNSHLRIHPLVCNQCGKTFSRKPNLQLHLRRHLIVKPYACTLCPKSFITRQKLDEHVNGHSGNKPLKCSLCDSTFSRHSNLIQHRNLHHYCGKKKVKDFVCRCGEVFHSLRKLHWHMEVHDTKPKTCPYCSQKFIHANSVTRHVRRSHVPDYLPTDKKDGENVQCPVCEKTYLRSSLIVHMRVHNGERPFACKICNKRFTTKWNLELHNWTHQSRNNMPFKCTICKSAFFREVDFVAHLNSHRNYRPFTCNICGQKFIRKYNCLRHQEEHKMEKKFLCTVAGCGKSFHRSYYLRDHMRIHTGVRPHTCHICGKASSTKSNHNKHLRIHDTREPMNTEN